MRAIEAAATTVNRKRSWPPSSAEALAAVSTRSTAGRARTICWTACSAGSAWGSEGWNEGWNEGWDEGWAGVTATATSRATGVYGAEGAANPLTHYQ